MTDFADTQDPFDADLLACVAVPEASSGLEERIISKARHAGLVKDGRAPTRRGGIRRWKLLALVAALVAAAAFAATIGGGLWGSLDHEGALGGTRVDVDGSSGESAGKGPRGDTLNRSGGRAGAGQGAAKSLPGSGGQVGHLEGKDGFGGVDGGEPGDAKGAANKQQDEPKACTAEVTVSIKGVGAQGVQVEFIRDSRIGHDPSKVLISRTGKDGVASFEGVTRGTWKAHAILEGHTQVKAHQYRCKGENELLKPTLKMERAAVLVYGRVTDREGTPVANSSVLAFRTVSRSDFGEALLASVDTHGRYRIWLPADAQKYNLMAGSIGHQPSGSQVPAHESSVEMDFQLLRYSTIHGTVIGPDGPVPEADVYTKKNHDKGTFIRGYCQTDVHGNFAFEAGPSEVEIKAHKGDLFGSATVPAPEEGMDVHGVVLVLNFGRKLTGTLRRPSGEPVANKLVVASHGQSSFTVPAKTDAEGRFEFTGLPPKKMLKVFANNPALKMPEVIKLQVEVGPEQEHVELLWEPAP